MRMDLTIWDPKHYRTGTPQNIVLWLGGNRWRCEPCRTNFVSLRPRRERYRRPGAEGESASSDVVEPNRSL